MDEHHTEKATLDGVHALLGMLREDLRREAERIDNRLSHLQRADETLTNQVTHLQRRIDHIDQQASKASETALGAMRKAQASVHEVESLSAGLMSHLTKLEAQRDKEANETTAMIAGVTAHLKSSARAGDEREQRTSRKFDEHKEAINSLAARGMRLQPWQLAIITGVLSAVIALAQIIGRVTETWIEHNEPVPHILKDGGI